MPLKLTLKIAIGLAWATYAGRRRSGSRFDVELSVYLANNLTTPNADAMGRQSF